MVVIQVNVCNCTDYPEAQDKENIHLGQPWWRHRHASRCIQREKLVAATGPDVDADKRWDRAPVVRNALVSSGNPAKRHVAWVVRRRQRLRLIIDQLEAGEVSLARAKELHEEGESLLEERKDELEVADGEVIDRFKDRFLTDISDDVDEFEAYKAVETTLHRAVRGKLTVERARESTDRALAVFAGPPRWLIRDPVADGRQRLGEELDTQEIRSDDIPIPDQSTLSVLVLLSGVTELLRLSELETLVEEAQ